MSIDTITNLKYLLFMIKLKVFCGFKPTVLVIGFNWYESVNPECEFAIKIVEHIDY